MVQQAVRARMVSLNFHLAFISVMQHRHVDNSGQVGFGQLDRRTLIPAPIVCAIPRNVDGELLAIEDVDISFLVLHVDLWSADGTSSRNWIVDNPPASSPQSTATPSKKVKTEQPRAEASASSSRANDVRCSVSAVRYLTLTWLCCVIDHACKP